MSAKKVTKTKKPKAAPKAKKEKDDGLIRFKINGQARQLCLYACYVRVHRTQL